MSNAQKVSEFLDKTKVFYFLTIDGNQPKGRPFGFQMLVDDKLYFGCGTFKNVFKIRSSMGVSFSSASCFSRSS